VVKALLRLIGKQRRQFPVAVHDALREAVELRSQKLISGNADGDVGRIAADVSASTETLGNYSL
jgi:hypothetical protein